MGKVPQTLSSAKRRVGFCKIILCPVGLIKASRCMLVKACIYTSGVLSLLKLRSRKFSKS